MAHIAMEPYIDCEKLALPFDHVSADESFAVPDQGLDITRAARIVIDREYQMNIWAEANADTKFQCRSNNLQPYSLYTRVGVRLALSQTLSVTFQPARWRELSRTWKSSRDPSTLPAEQIAHWVSYDDAEICALFKSENLYSLSPPKFQPQDFGPYVLSQRFGSSVGFQRFSSSQFSPDSPSATSFYQLSGVESISLERAQFSQPSATSEFLYIAPACL
jgi:hypothetical protein